MSPEKNDKFEVGLYKFIYIGYLQIYYSNIGVEVINFLYQYCIQESAKFDFKGFGLFLSVAISRELRKLFRYRRLKSGDASINVTKPAR